MDTSYGYCNEEYRLLLEYINQHRKKLPEETATHVINLYVVPLVLAVGTVSNIISCLVLCRLMRQLVTTYCYLSAAAVLQMLIIWIRCGNEWISKVANFDITLFLMNKYSTVCKGYPTLTSFLQQMSVWLIVCMAIEGALIARDPRALVRTCNLKRAKAVIALLTVLLLCPNVHFFWTYELLNLKKYSLSDVDCIICTYSKYGKGHYMTEAFVTAVWPIVDIFIKLFLPYIFIFICFIIILVNPVRKVTTCNGSHTKGQSLIMASLHESRRIKIAVCTSYLLLCLPFMAFTLYKSSSNWIQSQEVYEEGTEVREAREDLAQSLTELLEHIFRSTQLFIYLALSPKFRKICISFTTWCCRRRLLLGKPSLEQQQQPLTGPTVTIEEAEV